MQPKTIWIINQYASTPETGTGGRHYYLAKGLANQGHSVYLIASSFNHLLHRPMDIKKSFFIQQVEGFKFVWINMQPYRNAHDKKRIWNWFKFTWMLLKLPKILTQKPDAILASSPSPFVFLGAKRLAKKYNAKLAFEERDIWPLTLVELGGYTSKHPFIRMMQFVKDKAYRESDVVLSNLPNAIEHMVNHGLKRDKFHWIPNGFDLAEVLNTQPLSNKTLQALPKDKFIVGYTGTLGIANALVSLLEAANLLKSDESIAFVLVGSGKDKKDLIEKCEALGLNNISFIETIPKQQIQTMLAHFDICYIGWKNEPIYRFGIASSKLPEYLYSGKPIVHSFSGHGDMVVNANAGISVPAESPSEIANAILKLKALSSSQRAKLGMNGHQYALKYHNYENLAEKLAKVLFE